MALQQQLEEATNQAFSDAEEIARLSAKLEAAQHDNARLAQQAQAPQTAASPRAQVLEASACPWTMSNFW